jgi:hypothetical protein
VRREGRREEAEGGKEGYLLMMGENDGTKIISSLPYLREEDRKPERGL